MPSEMKRRRKKRTSGTVKKQPSESQLSESPPIVPRLSLEKKEEDDVPVACSSSERRRRSKRPLTDRKRRKRSKAMIGSEIIPPPTTRQEEESRLIASSSGQISKPTTQSRDFPQRYRKMETIRSQTGTLYRCFDEKTNQFVMIKEQRIKERDCLSPRGFHECTIVRYINDPENKSLDSGSRFVIEFVDQYTNPRRDSFYLVTPYYIRGDLFDLQDNARGHPSFPHMVKDLFRDVLFGLRYLHDIGVAHRDIKPENIFVHFDSALGRESARIADFGFATIIDENGKSLSVDNPGTLLYASPEAVVGSRGQDSRPSDIWSFASSLFVVVYGWYPFIDYRTSVKENMTPEEDRKLCRMLATRILDCDSNHLRMKLPAEAEPEVLEIFSRCFVPREERPSAASLLQCTWFRALPSANSVLMAAIAPRGETLVSSEFNYLNGYDPSCPTHKNLFLHEEAPKSTHSRFRIPWNKK